MTTATAATKSYISWGLNSDDIYDEEGDVVGQDEYVLIEKLYVAPADRRQGVAREILREALAEIAKIHSGMTVKLAALPFGDDAIDMADLVAFYESEGFSIDNCDGHAVIMVL